MGNAFEQHSCKKIRIQGDRCAGTHRINGMTRSDLLEIFDDRAGNKATLITSQLPLEHWHAWIGDVTIADAILDRVIQRNHRFTLTGDSPRAHRSEIAKKEKSLTRRDHCGQFGPAAAVGHGRCEMR